MSPGEKNTGVLPSKFHHNHNTLRKRKMIILISIWIPTRKGSSFQNLNSDSRIPSGDVPNR